MSKSEKIIKFTNDDIDNPVIFADVGSVENSESLAKNARLFYVGTHKGREYSKNDLKKIVDNFKPDESVPVQLDHSTSARDTVGIVKSVALSKDGSEINGEVEFKGKDNVDKVRLGLWKKVSVGLSIKQPEMKLLEVSITPFPALKDTKVFSEDNDNGGEEEVKNSESENEKTKAKEKAAMAEPETGKAEKVNMAEIEKIKAQFAELKAEKEELAEKINFKEDKEVIENFVQEGKILPATMARELKLYHSLKEDEQREDFIEIKKAQPAFYDLKTYNTRKADKPGEMSDVEADKESNDILRHTSFAAKIETVKV